MSADQRSEDVTATVATIGCARSCEVPEGSTLTPVPTPRHAWSDVIVCPHEDCGAAFLVTRAQEATDA